MSSSTSSAAPAVAGAAETRAHNASIRVRMGHLFLLYREHGVWRGGAALGADDVTPAAKRRSRRNPRAVSPIQVLFESRGVDPVLADGVADDPLGRVEQPRGLGPVAPGALERVLDEVLLLRVERFLEGLAGEGARDLGGLQGGREVVGVDHAALANEDGALQAVLELTHV